MAASDAGAATRTLRKLLSQSSYQYVALDLKYSDSVSNRGLIKSIIEQVTNNSPLVQHITNKVHQNFGANVALALGSSPIMSEVESEVDELAHIPNASLLVNTGTVAPVEMLKTAIAAYNNAKRPIVFDPVGYSATQTRLILNDTLLTYGQFTCIKGNSGEILSLANLNQGKMKGVDAGEETVSKELLARATRVVAYKYKTCLLYTSRCV